jgi:2-polyprenyl-6-methoxyphenol hydroxylase-like FAD-dependent oxidoreductase
METCRQERIPQIGEMHTHDGQFVGCVTFGLSTVRSSFHRSLLQYAAHLGIDVRLSARVVDYFEDSDKGGVVLDTGAKITADLVVAADGIGSRSGVVIKGERDQPTSSGYAMLRATYPTERIRQNPLLREFLEDRSSTKGVVGPGAHIITGCSGDNVSWMLTHKVCPTTSQYRICADCVVSKGQRP